jgi:WD40 repeat protein
LTRRKIYNFKLFDYDLNRNVFRPNVANTFEFKSFGTLELSHTYLTEISGEMQNVIACSFNHTNISVWNLNTSSMIKSLKGHTSGIRCLTLFDKNKLISGSKDKTIKVWCLLSGECLETLVGHTDEIWSVKVLHDGAGSQSWVCLFIF